MAPTAVRLLFGRLAGVPIAESDAELLRRFAEGRDEAAFAALVGRHGPLVLGICRRLLWDEQDVEDAFQATFLVLARNTGAVRRPASLAAWLYGVARRVALRARQSAARRADFEPLSDLPERGPDPLQKLTAREMLDALDAEMARLPEKYRLPLVLCALEGATVEQAASRLGTTPGAVSGYLQRGRCRLGRALSRRGLTLAAILPALTLPRGTAGVPPRLAAAAVRSAVGPAATSSRVTALAEGLSGVTVGKLASGAALVVTLGFLAVGAALAYPAREVERADAAETGEGNEPPQRVDRFGDPLPPGALARLGTIRWRFDGGTISALAVSRDGKTLTAVCPNTGIFVFDMTTGKVVRRLPEEETARKELLQKPAGKALLSEDGRTAVFIGDGIVHVVDTATGRERRRWNLSPGREVVRAALSADGRTLATVSVDGPLYVSDTETGRLLREFPGVFERTTTWDRLWLALSADGKVLAQTDVDGERAVYVSKVDGMEAPRRLEQEEKGEYRQIALSPDGRHLAASSYNGQVQLWDVATTKVVHRWPGSGRPQLGQHLITFAPDGRTLIVDGGGTFALFDIESREKRWRYTYARMSVLPPAYAFTPEGKTILAVNHAVGPFVFRFDAATGRRLLAPGEVDATEEAACFSADGRTLHTLGGSGSLGSGRFRSRDIRTGEELRRVTFDTWPGHFTPDGRRFTAWWSGHVKVFDTESGTKVSQFANDVWSFNWLALSPDGKVAAAVSERPRGSQQKDLVFYDADSGKELHRTSGLTEFIRKLLFSDDGSTLYAFGVDMQHGGQHRFHSWDVKTGRELSVREFPRYWVDNFGLSPDGRTLYVHGSDQLSFVLVEAATGRERLSVGPLRVGLAPFAFTADQSLVLIAADGGVQIHDAASGELLARRPGHYGVVTALAWSPDGRLLTTSATDSTTLVWDARTFVPARATERPPSESQLRALWADLASDDGRRAYQAVCKLAAAGAPAVALARERLHPALEAVTGQDRVRLRRLVADLDADEFAVRERAARDLERLGEFAQPAYDEAKAGSPSPEVTRRIQDLEAKYAVVNAPLKLQTIRAVEVLERIGTADARRVLEQLAKGAAGARLTQEAKGSLRRLAAKSG
jgi:RNA polymerase sigma factor (sigma-70 family)